MSLGSAIRRGRLRGFRIFGIFGLILFALLSFPLVGRAQRPNIRVVLASTAGAAGLRAVVPIYFTPDAGSPSVGRLKLEISFVSRNLKFARLEPGIAAALGGTKLEADVLESTNEQGLEISTIRLLATSPEDEEAEDGIRGGLLAYLTFVINENASPARVTLRTSVEAEELGTKKPITLVEAIDGQVEVTEAGTNPLITCFFFTH